MTVRLLPRRAFFPWIPLIVFPDKLVRFFVPSASNRRDRAVKVVVRCFFAHLCCDEPTMPSIVIHGSHPVLLLNVSLVVAVSNKNGHPNG